MQNGLGERVLRLAGGAALAVLAVVSAADMGLRMGLAPAAHVAGAEPPALVLLRLVLEGASHVGG